MSAPYYTNFSIDGTRVSTCSECRAIILQPDQYKHTTWHREIADATVEPS